MIIIGNGDLVYIDDKDGIVNILKNINIEEMIWLLGWKF